MFQCVKFFLHVVRYRLPRVNVNTWFVCLFLFKTFIHTAFKILSSMCEISIYYHLLSFLGQTWMTRDICIAVRNCEILTVWAYFGLSFGRCVDFVLRLSTIKVEKSTLFVKYLEADLWRVAIEAISNYERKLWSK